MRDCLKALPLKDNSPGALGGDGALLSEPGDGARRAGGSLNPASEQQSGTGLHIHLRGAGDHCSALWKHEKSRPILYFPHHPDINLKVICSILPSFLHY